MKKTAIMLSFVLTLLIAGGCRNDSISENGFKFELGAPVVVGQGPSVDEVGWGPYQFPKLTQTSDLKIYATIGLGQDSANDYENKERRNYMSVDDGKTWQEVDSATDYSNKSRGLKMPNDKNFIGFLTKNAYEADVLPDLKNHKPIVNYKDKDYSLYYANDIEGFSNVFTAEEYDEKTDSVERFQAKINWEYMPLEKIGNRKQSQSDLWDKIIAPESLFALTPCSGIIMLDDGTLVFTMYCVGFDSLTGNATFGAYNVYLFSSTDSGRTWNYYSQILTGKEIAANSEGFCEPSITRAPDGSYIILMRTGANKPCYITRSTDDCKSWSEPEIFDDIGVFPQIVTLKCGVTLASYGRPGLYLRWTGDPSCEKWNERIDLGITADIDNHGKYSCCYTYVHIN